MTAAGMYLIQYGHTNTNPTTESLTIPATYLGAALLGAATALALPGPLHYRVLAAAPLALTAAVLATGNATGTLATLYALATTARWLTRTGQLLHSPRTPRPQPTTPPAG